jgi:hypothetical protein
MLIWRSQNRDYFSLNGVLVSEGTRSPSGGRAGDGTSVVGELNDGSLTIGSGRDDLSVMQQAKIR